MADLLERASARIGHRIYLLSDEPYRRLRFDGREFVSPAAVYPWTFISYSYGKVLLAPGQRLGYLAISPLMPDAERRAFSDSMFAAQMALGWCFPNAVMQYAIPDLETLSIDQAALTRRRDRLMSTLGDSGYDVPPAGRHVLSVEQMARRRPGTALESPSRSQRLRAAGQPHERAWLFSNQPHGVRRHGRARTSGIPGPRAAVDVAGEKEGPGGFPAPMSDYDFLVTFNSSSFASMSSADVAGRTAVSIAATLPVLSM